MVEQDLTLWQETKDVQYLYIQEFIEMGFYVGFCSYCNIFLSWLATSVFI